jgi:hypothetical protein
MPVERLDFLGQDGVAGLLAEQGQEVADGLIDQPALFGFGCSLSGLGGLCLPSQIQLLDGGFDDSGCDFAASGLFDGALPGQLRLFGGEADQRPNLGFVLRLRDRAGTFSPIQL